MTGPTACSSEDTPHHSARYTEYRRGLMRIACEGLARCGLNEEQRQKFLISMASSGDIMSLINESNMFSWLDNVGGSPKLLMTIAAKLAEARIGATMATTP